MSNAYQICTRCVMDTTDPDIQFDAQGMCSHCHRYDDAIRNFVFSGDEGQRRLAAIVERIKREGERQKYDCVIGVSGGVDSTYVAYKAKELGLRPLAVHLDNGWDSELAVNNIHKALNRLNIDLYTHVIDWEEFKDLQLAFLKASTPDSEIPSDHAIVSLMYHTAARINVKYILAGYNTRTESHLPKAWSQGHWDWTYIKGVHRRFGTIKLRTYPHMGFWRCHWYRLRYRMINILDYLDYNKTAAMQTLERELGWQYYGGKHYESIYTRFYQGYLLPTKFGYDKRRVHLSSLICSGEITRAEALEELERPAYPPELQEEDIEYVLKKLGLTAAEFDSIMRLPRKAYGDYPSQGRIYESAVYQYLLTLYRKMRHRELVRTGLYG